MNIGPFLLATYIITSHGLWTQTVRLPNERQAKLGGMDVSMSLVHRNDRTTLKSWPDERAGLTIQVVPIVGRTIQEVLAEHHIFPDLEAVGLVYELNRDIEDLNASNIKWVTIPLVESGPRLKMRFAEGYAVLLTADRSVKERFHQAVIKFTENVAVMAQFAKTAFPNDSAMKALIDSLQRTSDHLVRIDQRIKNRFGRSIPTEAVHQLTAEVDLLNRSLIALAASGRSTDKEVQWQVEAVSKDVKIKAEAFTEVAAGRPPKSWPRVVVAVKTLKEGSLVHNLRVYYAPEALKERAEEIRSFSVLSSPATQQLLEADYCFWAAKDPDRSAITNMQCQEVRQNGGTIEIQLSVTP
jgi:hypothetical protein